ncbi:diguanylate cyclase domain-containing protein [Clostridium cavendishii]|nr:diguanylate cyclase [Clostridium cavendishii]
MFFLIYILTLLNSGGHDSNFKLLFLFIIITSSIEFRMKTSFCYAILSTISLLILDLWYGINYPLNIYFKKELLISCSFFFSSILIGYFVNFAKSNINNLENLIDTELISFKKNNKFSFNDLKLLLNKSFKDNTNICVALISVDNINFDDFNSNKYNPLIDDIFKIIKYHLNNNDILVPYKKNILILILPSKNEIDALNLCHNIVATANDALISGPIINSKYNFNFSIGISCSNHTVYNEFDLISYARIALKHAKLSKNNKIIPYSYIDEFNKKQQIF